ncbi:MAG: CBM35 domain-containing protein [Verrucomicrobiales bacterium]|nr:CBM35 domain-containing protein [Verrucomicrobiales bacterium]
MKRTLIFTVVTFLSWIAQAGTSPHYTINDIPVPPSKFSSSQIDGLTFLPDGRLVVCLPSGEIFFYDYETKKWELFAQGLHNPLGVIALSNSELIVSQRPELTRVRDTDGDRKADDYEVMTDQFGMSGNYHEFHFTPVRDEEGSIYFALGTGSSGNGIRPIVRGRFDPRGRPGRMHSSTPYRGCVVKLTKTGETIPWAYGLRTPNGLGFDLKGNLFATDNQGDWVGSSKLFHIKKDRFYGHAASLTWKPGFEGIPLETSAAELYQLRTRACVVFPHGTMANSPTQVLAISEKAKIGPFTGQLLVGEMNQPRIMRVMLEEVGGELQGACVPFIDGSPLRGGCNRMDFAPDGSLYIGQTKHSWAGSQGIQQVVWDGTTPFEVQDVKLTKTGFRYYFTKPVDREIAGRKETWSFLRYYFEYHESYGSAQMDESVVQVDSINISEDGKVVDVNLSELKAWYIHQLNINQLSSADGDKLWNSLVVYTLNRLLENTPPEPPQFSESTKKKKRSIEPIPVKNPRGIVYEAERALLDGPVTDTNHSGFSGTGYIDFGNGDQSVKWTVETEVEGINEIQFRYALGSGRARPLKLLVNDEEVATLPFESTESWTKWVDLVAKVDLKIGENTITLETTGKSAGNIDHLQLVE